MVVARGKVGDERRAVVVDGEVEVAFAARGDARDFLHGGGAAGDLCVVGDAVGVGRDVDTGVGQIAVVADEFGQEGDFRGAAGFANGKADAQAVLVERREDALDVGEALFGGGEACGVEVFAEGVGDDAYGLDGVVRAGKCGGEAVALALGVRECVLPGGLVGGERDKGGDGADAAERKRIKKTCHFTPQKTTEKSIINHQGLLIYHQQHKLQNKF